MRHRFLIGSATVVMALAFGVANFVYAIDDPIPGVDIIVKKDPGAIAMKGQANFVAGASGGTWLTTINWGDGTPVGDAMSAPVTFTVTATFPEGYGVTAAATHELSSACLSNFSFTTSTVTATETNCSGDVTLGGINVTVFLNTNVTKAVDSASDTGTPTPTIGFEKTFLGEPLMGLGIAVGDLNGDGVVDAKELKQCKATNAKKLAASTHSITATYNGDLSLSLKTYQAAIKAAKKAYAASLAKAATDMKAAKASARAEIRACATGGSRN